MQIEGPGAVCAQAHPSHWNYCYGAAMPQKSALETCVRDLPSRDCVLRAASFNDYDGIAAVTRRNGIGSPVFEDWARLWTKNPCWSEMGGPIGWVLENESLGIVGAIGNIPRMYWFDGEPVRAATANAWAVDAGFRHGAVSLAAEFFAQYGVDLFLSTTASSAAGAVYKAFGCEEVLGPSCAEIRYWITGAVGFAGAALKKKGWPRWLLKHLAGGAIYCAGLPRRPRCGFGGGDVELLPGFDERFDIFWERLKEERGRLLAVRSRLALEWQFRRVRESGECAVLGLKGRAGLDGYLVMNRYDEPRTGLRRFRVVDLQVMDENSGDVRVLMEAGLAHARKMGVHVVEAMGMSKGKRNNLDAMRPHRRMLASCPYLYKAGSEALAEALAGVDAWDASPFDGDAAL
jgi:hypothetical protein